jgi:hypothetical protein
MLFQKYSVNISNKNTLSKCLENNKNIIKNIVPYKRILCNWSQNSWGEKNKIFTTYIKLKKL